MLIKSSHIQAVLVVLLSCGASGCATTNQSLLPWNTTVRNTPMYDQQLSLARLSERHGNITGAKKIYRDVLIKDPENLLALHRMGVVSGKQGDFDSALEYLTAAQSIGSPSAELLSDIGYMHYLADNHEQAQLAYREALNIDPDYLAARTNLGMLLGELGEYDAAFREFRAVSDDAEAYSNLAYVQSQRGDLETAKQNYLKALSLDRSLKAAAEALVQLEGHQPPIQQFVPGPPREGGENRGETQSIAQRDGGNPTEIAQANWAKATDMVAQSQVSQATGEGPTSEAAPSTALPATYQVTTPSQGRALPSLETGSQAAPGGQYPMTLTPEASYPTTGDRSLSQPTGNFAPVSQPGFDSYPNTNFMTEVQNAIQGG
ncbi:MAG: tetratricopeptide repeat protein [Pirellulaceae bacterium]